MSEAKHTPGPWRWEVNLKQKSVSLCGGTPKFDVDVMDFVRWGFSGGAPRFNTICEPHHMRLVRIDEMAVPVPGREHHGDWFRTIDNPNARLIAAAPGLLAALEEIANWPREYEVCQIARYAIAKAKGETA